MDDDIVDAEFEPDTRTEMEKFIHWLERREDEKFRAGGGLEMRHKPQYNFGIVIHRLAIKKTDGVMLTNIDEGKALCGWKFGPGVSNYALVIPDEEVNCTHCRWYLSQPGAADLPQRVDRTTLGEQHGGSEPLPGGLPAVAVALSPDGLQGDDAMNFWGRARPVMTWPCKTYLWSHGSLGGHRAPSHVDSNRPGHDRGLADHHPDHRVGEGVGDGCRGHGHVLVGQLGLGLLGLGQLGVADLGILVAQVVELRLRDAAVHRRHRGVVPDDGLVHHRGLCRRGEHRGLSGRAQCHLGAGAHHRTDHGHCDTFDGDDALDLEGRDHTDATAIGRAVERDRNTRRLETWPHDYLLMLVSVGALRHSFRHYIASALEVMDAQRLETDDDDGKDQEQMDQASVAVVRRASIAVPAIATPAAHQDEKDQ